jgi:hypothetical protein
MTPAQFKRLVAMDLAPKPIERINGTPDRWRVDAVRAWKPPVIETTPRRALVRMPRSVPLAPGVHHLYRHFDAAGKLLYVGISFFTIVRLCDHRHESAWFWRIARVEFTGYAAAADARLAERLAILREKPLHNEKRSTRERLLRREQPHG